MTPYFWFKGATVEALAQRLTQHPGARLEVHPSADGQHCTLLVVPAESGATTEGPLNESFLCPPICP